MFPRWLRRIDPTLEAEDTNGLFLAFRDRRRDHTHVIRVDFLYDLPKFITYSLGVLFFFMIFFGQSVLGLRPATSRMHYAVVYATWVFSFLVIVVQFFLRGKRRNYLVLPRRVSGVFRTLDFLEQQAVDLWLAGVRGSDVALALYLETWERTYQLFRVLAPLVWFYVFFLLGLDMQNRGLADLYFYPLALLLVAELSVAALLGLSFFAYGIVDFRHDCWLKYIDYRKFILRNIIGGLIGVILVLGFAMLLLHFKDIRKALIAFFATDEIADITVKLAIITSVLLFVLVAAQRFIQFRVRRQFVRMDRMFHLLMHKAAMGDPDFDKHLT